MVDEFPDQYAFRYTTMDYTRTYSEFRDDVDTFARSLIALGVKPGDHVAIWATNVPQWYITFWATTKIGAVLVTVNTAYKIYEAEYLLRQSDTHTLVMIDGYKDSDYVGIIKELCPELETAEAGKPLHMKRLPFLRNIITVDSKQKGCLTWEEAIAMSNSVPIEEVYRRDAFHQQARCLQHAVYLGNHRLSQRRNAHPLQCCEQWQKYWRLHGSFHRRPHDDSSANVPLFWNGACHDCRNDPWCYHVSDALFFSEAVTCLYQQGENHLLPRRSHHVYCHA